MSNVKKLMMTAAGGDVLNVEDVFSTYLYTGTSTTNAINNGIDLDGEGGIVWIKNRDGTDNHYIFGSESGNNWTKLLTPNGNGYYGGATNIFDSVSSTGFTVKSDFGGVNANGEDYASWTWRVAPKFFDIQTWTGDGTTGRQISHNLDATVGMMILKRTDSSGYWGVYHRSTDSTAPEDYALLLNSTSAKIDEQFFINDTAPTSTHFTVGATAASGGDFNANGATYVAYLFAHHDGDGTFGATGDQDIIKCGDVIGSGTTSFTSVDLGFEPQWIMIKRYDSTGGGTGQEWTIIDNMRFMGEPDGTPGTSNPPKRLYANSSQAENDYDLKLFPTATGFEFSSVSGYDYIYIAIRRGPMAVPESATDVFAVDEGTTGASGNAGRYRSGFPVDMGLERDVTGTDNWEAVTRLLQGTSLRPNHTTAEDTGVGGAQFDYMDGWNSGSAYPGSYSWMWKRAPNYFDVVAYTGNGVAGRTVSHNLGVTPDMIWVKERGNTNHWAVYHKGLNGGVDPEDYYVRLNLSNAEANSASYWNDTAPTDSVFTVAGATVVNRSAGTYIAYLFASLDGVSKVGSYTGNSSTTQNIDCGFSNGARFVMIKRTDASGNWNVYDTERGIVAGDDPRLELNTTDAEYTISDWVDPLSSGFTVVTFGGGDDDPNINGASYIFYAIA